MHLETLYYSIGGLGFFFFGMRTMSEGLKKIAGERLKNILHMVTKLPIVGVLVGTGITCLIQSSSATTVLVVGFVNAGLLALKQAISVVIGANIGTTFTAWLVSSMSVFKITDYALPCVGIGFAMMNFGNSSRVRNWGEVILGFGILFAGLEFLKSAFEPFKNSEHVKQMFVVFSHSPILGVLVGTMMTVLLQSSSATIAIIQVLAFNGLISFPATIPIILGDNIGTTITAQLAALGTNTNARRAAMSHTLFNVIGVAYMLFFVYTGWFVKVVEFIVPGGITLKNIMVHIAVSHSMFNVINAMIFLPLIGFLEKMSIRLVPKPKDDIEEGPQYLEKHLLETPSLAMQQARNEIIYMLHTATKAVTTAVTSFLEGNLKILKKAEIYERTTDNLQSSITQYLIDLSQRELTEEQSREIPVIIHNVNDLERIGDHARNLAELAQSRWESDAAFSEEALKEMEALWQEVKAMLADTEIALKDSNVEAAQKMLEREGKVNEMHGFFKEAHVKRLNKGRCNLNANFIFLDYIDNMEKIADHLTNIAQAVIGHMQWKMYVKQNNLSEGQPT